MFHCRLTAAPLRTAGTTRLLVLATSLAWLASGCGSGTGAPPTTKDEAMYVRIQSSAWVANGPVPIEYTGDGADRSPPLEWAQAPPATKEWAVVVDDPDAPTPQPWVHWVVYRIPAHVTALPAGLARDRELKEFHGVRQGLNSWNEAGYRGPAPPRGHGMHHYHFTLYALSAQLNLPPGATNVELKKRMAGRVLATAELVGTYQR